MLSSLFVAGYQKIGFARHFPFSGPPIWVSAKRPLSIFPASPSDGRKVERNPVVIVCSRLQANWLCSAFSVFGTAPALRQASPPKFCHPGEVV
jgi:hypothetical protein